jgi:hypothetical protein
MLCQLSYRRSFELDLIAATSAQLEAIIEPVAARLAATGSFREHASKSSRLGHDGFCKRAMNLMIASTAAVIIGTKSLGCHS